MRIDLQNIQIKHFTSQQDSFEELCCQIFKIMGDEQGWQNSAVFIDKNGVCGDAGVEAYWKFNNNIEYGIQAKFSDNLAQLWSQIDSSVKTALSKHPNLTKYYIFTPFNRTDMKQSKKDGMTIWKEYLQKWKIIKNIDFIWMGKHEIELELSKNNAYTSGLIKYWFDMNTFSSEWFQKHFEEMCIKANKRYSIDLNVQTSTKEDLLQIAKPKTVLSEYKKVYKELKEFHERLNKYNCFINYPEEPNVQQKINAIFDLIYRTIYYKDTLFKTEYIDELFEDVISLINNLRWNEKLKPTVAENFHTRTIYPEPTEASIKKVWEEYVVSNSYNFTDRLYKLSNFVKSANNKNILLFSSAGNGKTHLLCDLVNEMLKTAEFISVLSFGHYYTEKCLIDSIIKEFDNFTNIDELLGSLDSYAKSKNQVALFMIDGINEWESCSKSEIFTQIKLLKNKINEYSNIRFIISCREEYRKDIFGESSWENEFKFYRHFGFMDNSLQALHEFCYFYKIEIPSTPLLTPELSNPLILKTLCEAFSVQKKFPKGISGVSNIFQAYLNYLNYEISTKLDLDPDDNIICEVIKKISKLIYQNNGDIHIEKKKVKDVIKDIDTNKEWSKTILCNLEKNGLFVINKDYIYISYDRYRDFLTVNSLLEDINEPKLINSQAKLKEKIQLFKDTSFIYSGVIDFLSIAVPEKWGFELIELYVGQQLDWELRDKLISSFYRSISQRDVGSTSEKTVKAFEHFKDKSYDNDNHYWQTLISCASIENHPLNADYLHEKLSKLSMADIDEDWTQFISTNYENTYDRSYHDTNNYFSIKHLILPFLKINDINFSDRTIELISTLFIWFTTSTNRILRDIATVATVNILRNKEKVLLKLLNKFKDVNDIFLQERLYSIANGVTLFSSDKESVNNIADFVFETIFKQEIVYPNILIRIDAFGIIDHSKNMGNDISKYKVKHIPPYNYPLITNYPSFEDIENRYDKRPGTEEEKELWSTGAIYSSALAHSGDFARYVISGLGNNWQDIPDNQEYCAWIAQKAYEFGWDYKKHGKFDYNINRHQSDRSRAYIERIGKKYQWLAYHEYLCNLIDNYKLKEGWNPSTIKIPGISNMIDYRNENIDPSLIINRELDEKYFYYTPRSWTHPNIYSDDIFIPINLERQIEWLNTTQDNICKGVCLIDIKNSKQENLVVLNNFISQKEDIDDSNLTEYYRDFGIHVRSFFCKSNSKEQLINLIGTKFNSKINGFNLYYDGNDIIGTNRLNCLEYPQSELFDSKLCDIYLFQNDENIENYSTIMEYYRTSSFYNSCRLYFPHPKLIEKLNLHIRKDGSYIWEDDKKNSIFYNTILLENPTEYNVAIANKKNLLNQLNKTDMSLIFSVSVEKRLLHKDVNSHAKRYPGMYYLSLYELKADGVIEEKFHNSYEDR